MEIGKLYRQQGKGSLALEEFKKAIEINPSSELAHFEAGNLYLNMRNENEAEKEYKRVLELNPKFFYASLELGKLYYYRQRRDDLAVKEFDRVLSESPSHWEANYLLGKIHKQRGEYMAALRKLEKACESEPDRQEVRFELGKTYRDLDMPELSVSQFEAVLSIGDNRNDVFMNNKVLNEIEITRKKTLLESKVRAMVAMITNKCNLKCIICNIWKTPWQASDRTMDEIVRLFPYIEDMVWEGGEVLLMKGFDQILEEAYKYVHLKQVIFTNGLVFNERIIDRLANGRVDIVFSIDGTTKQTYEHIRNGGRFEHLIRNLGLIKQAKTRAQGRLATYFNSIIMRSNYKELEKMIDFAKEYDFNAVTLTPIRGRFGEENIFEDNDPQAMEDIRRAIPAITKKAHDYGIMLNNWLPGMQTGSPAGCAAGPGDETLKAQEAAGPLPKNKIICFAPWQRLVIDSEGQARPFVFCLNKWIGNTDRDSLEDIWNGQAMQEYRRRLLQGEYHGLCQPECISGQVADKIRDVV